jgi:hypothetical protein
MMSVSGGGLVQLAGRGAEDHCLSLLRGTKKGEGGKATTQTSGDGPRIHGKGKGKEKKGQWGWMMGMMVDFAKFPSLFLEPNQRFVPGCMDPRCCFASGGSTKPFLSVTWASLP